MCKRQRQAPSSLSCPQRPSRQTPGHTVAQREQKKVTKSQKDVVSGVVWFACKWYTYWRASHACRRHFHVRPNRQNSRL
ncbi:hypothetical protein pneo_cds_455 [Pandoravirus neocaledonia]|uniref:Uncharacterized protein n=1 Tax=Pandoravirus neocaledonia TaxID=2107708 RepID=A0A2U7UCE0_9VIRU|nr:hypothetical protein pneo_cds_455 [Pandoravirus neocaledonia]AVK76062.1 hypothetical protein pneo_cds_455 [Pandoravirus neocaledonia]